MSLIDAPESPHPRALVFGGGVPQAASECARILWYDPDGPGVERPMRSLQGQGHFVRRVGAWSEARRALSENGADLIIMEVNLDAEDGLGLCQSLARSGEAPILVYSDRADPLDRVAGLEFGADDYLSKDSHGLELLARVKALLRRSRRHASGGSAAGGWRFDRQDRLLTSPRGKTVRLRPAPAELLQVFLDHAGVLLSRDEIAIRLLGRADRISDRLIDVRVSRLRRALNACDGAGAFIQTERGGGYVFTAARPARPGSPDPDALRLGDVQRVGGFHVEGFVPGVDVAHRALHAEPGR